MNNAQKTARELVINGGVPFLAIFAILLADSATGTGHFDIIRGFGFDHVLVNLALGLAFAFGLTVIGFAFDGVLIVGLCKLLDIEKPGFLLLTYGATAAGALALRLGALVEPAVVHLQGALMPLLYANSMVMLTWLIASLFFTSKDLPIKPERRKVKGRSLTEWFCRTLIWDGVWAAAGLIVARDNGLLSLPFVLAACIGGLAGGALVNAAIYWRQGQFGIGFGLKSSLAVSLLQGMVFVPFGSSLASLCPLGHLSFPPTIVASAAVSLGYWVITTAAFPGSNYGLRWVWALCAATYGAFTAVFAVAAITGLSIVF